MKEKKHFDVYVVITRSFDNVIRTEHQFAGETYAVSEAQATNNVRFRLWGATPSYYEDSGYGDDWRSWEMIAVPSGTKVELIEVKDLNQ